MSKRSYSEGQEYPARSSRWDSTETSGRWQRNQNPPENYTRDRSGDAAQRNQWQQNSPPRSNKRRREERRSRSRDRNKRSRSRDRVQRSRSTERYQPKDRGSRSISGSRDDKRNSDDDKHSIFAELLGMNGGKERGSSPVPEAPKKLTIDEKARKQRKKVKMNQLCSTVYVRGNNAPPPIEVFTDQASLPQAILDNLTAEDYTSPTPVQKYSVPIICKKYDCMCCATTGSGKTLAFLIPIIANLLNEDEVFRPFFPGKNASASPLVVILAPTRELCIQIDEQVYGMTKNTWISSFAIFGGDNYASQSSQLGKSQIDILSATPGRLIDMVNRCKICFQFIKCVAFDEADNMLELGFEKAITEIMLGRDMPSKESRQTVMFSATFPRKIQELAKKYLKNDFIFVRLGETGRTTRSITQRVKYVEYHQKYPTLLSDLKKTKGKVIVFVSRRQHADKVATFLQSKGLEAGGLHGNMDQDTREDVIHKFKDDAIRILCATDVAARGLDFPEIELVLNFDMPQNLEVYTHRIGRTGRIGAKGISLSYFTSGNTHLAHQLKEYLRESKQEVPSWLSSMTRRGGSSRSKQWKKSGRSGFPSNRWRGA